MIEVNLEQREHNRRIGSRCEYIEPTVSESCLLKDDGVTIGAYIHDVREYDQKLAKIMTVANAEFRSDNVPKQLLERSDVMSYTKAGLTRKQAKQLATVQYSTILGSIPPKPLMRRNYRNRSSVHREQKANQFVKAMLFGAQRVDEIFRNLMPQQHDAHVQAVADIQEKWRFGRLFTSSISNFNIAAPFHRDRANIRGTLNAIYTVRENAQGGCLYVPDYDACFEMPSHSLLLYPAWRNTHAVTPIKPTHDGGYRNSLVWYALEGFFGDEHSSMTTETPELENETTEDD